MPQSGPQATPPFVAESTTSKTTQKTVPTEVTEAFKGFLSSVFGQNPATATPGTQTPAVVGGLPPQLTPAQPLSLPTPVPLTPRQPQQPVRGIAPAGTQYGSGAAAAEANTAALGSAVVSAITSIKAKKDEDNIARAQNTMNIFLHAVQQGDMATANLYASDPKVTGMWEKYLKQEYKRVPGAVSTGAEQTPPNLVSAKAGGINEPGGIAVPRDMTPEGQIRAKQLQAIQDTMSGMTPQQIAAASSTPGADFSKAELSTPESKQASMIKYGLAIDKTNESQFDVAQKVAMANTMADVMKYAVGQQAMTERSMIAAGATTGAARIAADSRLKVAQEHIKGMKDLQNLKGTALQTALYEQQMKTYGQLADDLQKKLSDPNYGKGWFSDADRTSLQIERDNYVKKQEEVRQEFEGFKMMQQYFPELVGAAPDETPASTPPAESEVQ